MGWSIYGIGSGQRVGISEIVQIFVTCYLSLILTLSEFICNKLFVILTTPMPDTEWRMQHIHSVRLITINGAIWGNTI